jgi:hypothetical protein
MKTTKANLAMAVLTFMLLSVWQCSAQEKPKPENNPEPKTLKLQLTVTEQEGEKKLSNLPYTIFVEVADVAGHSSPATKLRIGSRIPVATGVQGEKLEFQYIDIGTNLDARAYSAGQDKYELVIAIERSWVDGEIPAQTGANAGVWKQPSIHQFKTEFTLKLRDGQTIQSTQAADPLNGRVLTLTVTMSIAK